MNTKRLSILICLILLVQLCGCVLPEDQRFVNPTAPVDWHPTEPKETVPPPETLAPAPPSVKTAEAVVDDLSLPQQVAQLFLVKCPAGGASELLESYHVGGIVLYGQDTAGETPDSLRAELSGYQSQVPVRLIVAVDEEGGTVNRISSRRAFRDEPFPSPHEVYMGGGISALRKSEAEKALFLKNLGVNVNLAPVCDVVTEDDAFMADRSLRLTEIETAEAVAAMVEAMQANGVGAVLKHFPGYGNLIGDTHTGKVVDDRSMGMLRAYDFLPFQKGINAGVGAVMVSHSIVNAIDSSWPATLSAEVHRVLRDELGFQGVIITDDLAMGAITELYDPGEAAVQAILAGNDLLLTNWSEGQYQAILDAVAEGRISADVIRRSCIRIVQWKMDLGLL